MKEATAALASYSVEATVRAEGQAAALWLPLPSGECELAAISAVGRRLRAEIVKVGTATLVTMESLRKLAPHGSK